MRSLFVVSYRRVGTTYGGIQTLKLPPIDSLETLAANYKSVLTSYKTEHLIWNTVMTDFARKPSFYYAQVTENSVRFL